MTLNTTWLFAILAKAILELAAGGLTSQTSESLQDIVDIHQENAQ